MSDLPIRHILSLSGGKDSAALALYMRDRRPEMEYIFHDTDKELPETYAYLDRIQMLLGKPVHRTTPLNTFEHWMKVYGGIIPSTHRRWCTKMMKLKPFEDYVGEGKVYNYIGLRADEDREGYISHKPNIIPVYPFREDGLVRADIIRILEDSGLGMPKYTDWGRTRSGCFFCFYQQKIEWVRLRERYPERYEQAKSYEAGNKINGNRFFWSGTESLEAMEQPERIEQIKSNWAASRERARRKAPNKPLVEILGGMEAEDQPSDGCLICHL